MENKQLCLNDIAIGECGVVRKLLSEGTMRRRLLDIGLVENTEVECLGRSPAGDPTAFLIRGAVIAIRSEDCADILISENIRQCVTPTSDIVVALAGNPNVGKSTVFNALTGLKQHTGNWSGKTVANARGHCRTRHRSYVLVDLPGTYSLMAHSTEERVARDFICFERPDIVVVVCDATCLEHNLNLVLQTLEISSKVVVCVNLMDEAERKNMRLDLELLSKCLGVPVVGTVAQKKKSLVRLMEVLDEVVAAQPKPPQPVVRYPQPIEDAVSMLEPLLHKKEECLIPLRWLSLKLLDQDDSLLSQIHHSLGNEFLEDKEFTDTILQARAQLAEQGVDGNHFKDTVVSSLIKRAEEIASQAVHFENHEYAAFDRRLDRIFTSRTFGYPVMLLLLTFVFWLTITGANVPSRILSTGLFWIQERLTELFIYFHVPDWIHGVVVLGAYRVLAWVVSVMLPPMAIFFPLFTLLEDSGYLPRIAYNLDKPFKRCRACGKQALCMCMGFGCNAVGVIGCRIIDSPRERLLAILTNNFVPCNGRFPTLTALLTMFFVGTAGGVGASVLSAVLLMFVIVFGVMMTFIVTRILSRTLLRGMPSFFTLELPSYRVPQIGKVIVHSVFDRTLFVLRRAMAVAAPAGVLIWLMTNIVVGDTSVLNHCANFLNPAAKLMGLDGVILMAFLLGFPANEIVIPIIVMIYTSQGSILELDSLSQAKELFVAHGWTWVTAVSVMLFSLMHWPCSTTLLTIKNETGSLKWTVLAAVIPTVAGVIVCMLFTAIARMFSV